MNKIKSLLFIPALQKFLNKISYLEADAIIFDLEESILPNEKLDALNLLISTISEQTKKENTKWFVRLNKDNYKQEIKDLNFDNIDGFMLPKFENDYELQSNSTNKIIIALIETPLGIVNIENIVKNPLIKGLAFGAEDYTATMNMENNSTNLIYPKSKLLTYAKAYNKVIFDTPCLNITENKVIQAEVQQSHDMGFDGKLAIHPQQVSIINEIFNKYNYDYIKYVIDKYENNNSAVLNLDGKIYEQLHIKRLKKILKNYQ